MAPMAAVKPTRVMERTAIDRTIRGPAIAAAGLKSARILPNATLKIYEGAPHGLAETLPDKFNADLLAFIKGEVSVDPEQILIAQPIV